MTEFADQTVVVTGAGQGIGRAIALHFAREGATVALAARSVERLKAVAAEVKEAGGRAIVAPTDLRDPDAVIALRDLVEAEAGAASVLVNNSGISGPTGVLWQQDVPGFVETLAVNVTGVFLCCRAFLPAMLERGSGSVVVIGSMTGKRPLHGRTPYAASKTALIGLVRTLAVETGPAGIRVNLVSPGPVAGQRLDAVIASQAETKKISVAESRAQLASASPLGAFVEAAEIADAVLFLASKRAAKITGEDMNVSAGAVTYG